MISHSKNISPITSMAIAILRFPLPMAVMAIHFFRMESISIKGVVYDPSIFPITSFFIRLIDIIVGDFSVPVFFFVSGFLFFAGGFTSKSYIKKLGGRIHSLFVPYVLWNLIAVAFTWAFFQLLPPSSGQGFHMTWSEFFNGFTIGVNEYTNPHAGNLWFVRELMIVILLSPIINSLIDKIRFVYLAIVATFWTISFVCNGSMYLIFISSALLFFSLGACFSKAQIDPVGFFLKYWKYALSLFLTLSIMAMIIGDSTITSVRVIKVITIPCALIIAFSVAAIWGGSRIRLRHFGRVALSDMIPGMAFFLFVSHPLVLWHVKVLIFYICKPVTDISCLATYILAYLSMFVLLVATYLVIGKISLTFQMLISGRYKPKFVSKS